MSSKAKTKCFIVTWKIENFSAHLSSNIKLNLRSPVWKTKTTEESASWWRLLMGCFNSNTSIQFILTNLNDENDENLYEMSLVTSGGESPVASETSSCPSYPSCGSIEKSLILGKNGKSFLPKDTLTFCCRIRQQTIKPGKCLLRTVLHQVNFFWNIELVSFSPKSPKRTLHQHEMLLLYTILYKIKEDDTYHKVRIEFLPNTGICSALLSCQLGYIDDQGRVSSDSKDYPGASWSWDIEIYTSSPCLEIKCLVATDMDYQKITTHPSDTLTDDLLLLYKEKMYSDATLITEGKSFPVHKGLLAARSPVFCAMFEKNKMSEGRSGVVAIEDVDSATVDRMLVFLYGNSLEDVQWEEASSLYYAADKYGVLPLKQKCGDILKSGLTSDNACDLLVLADRHSDQELMKRTVNFILDHEEVLSSPMWKSLEESNPRLIIKTMRELYSKKGNK